MAAGDGGEAVAGRFTVGVAVMAKASAPGRTKTRLVPPLTPDEAAALNTAFVQDTVANLMAARELGAPIVPHVSYGPAGAAQFFRELLPAAVGLMEVWGLASFGHCLMETARRLLAQGHDAACVLNADGPTLPTALLVQLASALEAPGERVVLGPSDDGGYWVLGLKVLRPTLFEGIAWSTDQVAAQTLARAAEAGLPLIRLATWYDVDDGPSLRRAAGTLLHGRGLDDPAGRPFAAPMTTAALHELARSLDPAARPDLAAVLA